MILFCLFSFALLCCFVLFVCQFYVFYDICIYVDILKGLRPMPPNRTLHTSRPPDRLQVTSWGPRNQPSDQSILRAHSVRTMWGPGSPGCRAMLWGGLRVQLAFDMASGTWLRTVVMLSMYQMLLYSCIY